MKPYASIRNRKAEKKSPKATRYPSESRIAFASVTIAILSLIVAAISSYLSWRQIKILSNEHLTPYRSIYYATKIDSYKEVIGTVNRYQMSALQLRNLLGGHVNSRKNKHGATLNAELLISSAKSNDQIVKYAETINSMHEEYQVILAKNSGIWSNKTNANLVELMKYDKDLCLCSRHLTYKGYGYEDGYGPSSCLRSDFDSGFHERFEQIQKDMLKELRAEQVNSVG